LNEVPVKEVEMEGCRGVKRQLLIGSRDGSPNFSFRVFHVEPGGHTPYHVHESEHVNYIIRGQGSLNDENGKKHPFRQGDFCLVFPHEKHQFLNTSDSEELIFICAVMKEYE
jgi:quercetin dioxygenase-like cupin family protein